MKIIIWLKVKGPDCWKPLTSKFFKFLDSSTLFYLYSWHYSASIKNENRKIWNVNSSKKFVLTIMRLLIFFIGSRRHISISHLKFWLLSSIMTSLIIKMCWRKNQYKKHFYTRKNIRDFLFFNMNDLHYTIDYINIKVLRNQEI